MERTKKYRIWFQAARELNRKENMNRDTSYAKPLAVRVNLSRRNLLNQNDLLPKQRVQ